MKSRALVILPAFNEEKKIAAVIADLQQKNFKNILVVDDGSNDATAKIAQKCGAKILQHPINLGVGAATKTGIFFGLQKNFDFFLIIDADGQHSAADAEKILQNLTKKNFVLGSRFLQKNKIPIFRRLANYCANFWTGFFFGIWVTDSQSGLRGFSRRVAEKLDLHGSGFEFCSEFLREINWHNFEIFEIPISVKYSKNSLQKGQNFATGLKTLGKIFLQIFQK